MDMLTSSRRAWGGAVVFCAAATVALAVCVPALAQVPDTTPPTVTDVRAYDGVGGEMVLPGTVDFVIDTIVVTFSEDIDPATVSVETFRLVRSGGDGTFDDGNEVEIVPDSVTLSPGNVATMDLSGATLADDACEIVVEGEARGAWATPVNVTAFNTADVTVHTLSERP
jgi:hypothetical protein